MFETCVDQLIKIELMNESIRTEWYNGTVFVRTINIAQAEQIEAMLKRKEIGKVQMSPIGDTGEYAYDFV